jgi:hypothetical protein
MTVMTVDTLSLARELRAAEFAPAQAEAIASAIGRSIGETAATKADLRELKLELEAKLEAVQSKLVMWMIGSQITMAAILLAAIKL